MKYRTSRRIEVACQIIYVTGTVAWGAYILCWLIWYGWLS